MKLYGRQNSDGYYWNAAMQKLQIIIK